MSNGISTAVVKLAALLAAAAAQCQPRDYGRGSIVCVCNATYCDFIGDIGSPPNGTAVAFESSKAGQRFTKTTLLFSEETGSTDNHVVLLVVDPSRKYQKVFGFGGAFTDAAGINIKSLPANMQDDIIKSYYAKQGLAYTIGRIPLASCDFSTRKYTYDDSPGDLELKNFTLAPEDFNLKIPYIKAAMSVSSEPIWFFGSAWSSPSWMKTSNTLEGRGTLKGKPGGPYYKAWAKYYVRFVQEYERHGIPIWGLTTQNEPTAGFVPGYRWQALGFTPKTQRDFVKLDLGPALAEAGYGAEKLQVMILDDNRIGLPLWADVVLGDPEAAKFVHGVAVHWYLDWLIGPWVLDKVHEHFPDKFILATEACSGFQPIVRDKVKLGSWERAEDYASDILEDLNHWASGWTDWNLALDTGGGPNWANNFVDSPLIVNVTANEFYKQPTYYALAHFSKFLPRGSVRIECHPEQSLLRNRAHLEYAAFTTPDSAVVVVVLNKHNKKHALKIKDRSGSHTVEKIIDERSITTLIWR
ncbi:lysosomal acid glucosylceramidase isoform X1 [Rhipicephalus microplus]|uniref:lysosomal acid glucosylceramidase isoform X1 n=1 Tax=Rhipicephalus microplus TaxID=6941 RepID=UPI003F6C3215